MRRRPRRLCAEVVVAVASSTTSPALVADVAHHAAGSTALARLSHARPRSTIPSRPATGLDPRPA